MSDSKRLAPHIFRQRLLIEVFYNRSLDEEAIRKFLYDLAAGLGLGTYREPFVSSSSGIGADVNQGFEAFLPLIESGIALYTWNQDQFFSTVLFTCKAFDEAKAVEIVAQRFAATIVAYKSF